MKTLPLLRNALIVAALGVLPSITFAQVGVSITIAPPELPVYEQPICPEPNSMWTPGYWSWGDDGYYWVPGTWVEAPSAGVLWTPGYWGWNNGSYLWNNGYWGPQVGFYGGVDYGYGYGGNGFYGGRWNGGNFSYNTAVMNVNRTVIHNTYVDRRVVVNNGNRVSFNGGRGGIQARPTEAQMSAEHSKRFGPVAAQTRQVSLARADRSNYASVNHGMPAHAALERPATSAADFNRAVPARGAAPASHVAAGSDVRPATKNEYHPAAKPEARTETHPAARPEPAPKTESHPAAKTEARPENHATAHPESRPAPKTESHPAAKPEARTETHAATRPEPAPRAESHPAAKPEARPETHAAA
ncbi:MAG: hypothetical protein WBP63_17960, partial [Silvibacterium sp.]